jgi:hypothetical protein
MRLMKKVSFKGTEWCSVEDAAHYLRTTTQKVRELMGSEKLAYTQIRKNGRIYVSTKDLVLVQREKLYGKSESNGFPAT